MHNHPSGEGPYGLGSLLLGGKRSPNNVVMVNMQPHKVKTQESRVTHNGLKVWTFTTVCGLEKEDIGDAPPLKNVTHCAKAHINGHLRCVECFG